MTGEGPLHVTVACRNAGDFFLDLLRERLRDVHAVVMPVTDAHAAMALVRAVPDGLLLVDSTFLARDSLFEALVSGGHWPALRSLSLRARKAPSPPPVRVRPGEELRLPCEAEEVAAELLRQASPACGPALLRMDTVPRRIEVARVCDLAWAALTGTGMPLASRAPFMCAVREAVDNAARHGSSRNDARVYLQLSASPTQVKVTIGDDGQGFDWEQALSGLDAGLDGPGALASAATGDTGSGLRLLMHGCDDVTFDSGGSSVTLLRNLDAPSRSA